MPKALSFLRGLALVAMASILTACGANMSPPSPEALSLMKPVRLGQDVFTPAYPGISERGQMSETLGRGLIQKYGFVRYENLAALKKVGSENTYLVCGRFKKILSADESIRSVAMIYESGFWTNSVLALVDENDPSLREYCAWFDKPEYKSIMFFNG